MPVLHIVVLALVQGITEFLPVSSQGHLLLALKIMEGPDQGLVMIVAVHVGSLGAVMVYFWRDLWLMLAGLGRLTLGQDDAHARLAGYLVVASVPVGVAGFAFKYYLPGGLDSIVVIAWATLGFGVVLYVADRLGMTVRRIEHMGVGDAVIIGLAQVLALVPGTSRSGITISAGRLLGLERSDAARFSMLLSIPAILGAGGLEGLGLYRSGDVALTNDALFAAGLAFVAALLAIFLMMAWLRRSTFTPFVIYRLGLGGVLLAIGYGWLG